MNHVGTDDRIRNVLHNGLPEGEEKVVECPTCGHRTLERNLEPCTKCGHLTCPRCDLILVLAYDWRFCDPNEAVDYLVERIQDQDEKLFDIRQEVKIAIQELDIGNTIQATARLYAVWEQTK